MKDPEQDPSLDVDAGWDDAPEGVAPPSATTTTADALEDAGALDEGWDAVDVPGTSSGKHGGHPQPGAKRAEAAPSRTGIVAAPPAQPTHENHRELVSRVPVQEIEPESEQQEAELL